LSDGCPQGRYTGEPFPDQAGRLQPDADNRIKPIHHILELIDGCDLFIQR
jgi:hypothetical protein